MGLLKQWASALLGIVYPRLCEVCGRALVEGEDILCLRCLAEMPFYSAATFDDGDIHRRIMRCPIERAAALYYYYRDSPYAMLIQHAKYSHRPSLARALGSAVARRLLPDGFFCDIDAIVPVPLHKAKMRRRGYNQSLEIAVGVSAVTSVPVVDMLVAAPHSSQTARSRLQRWRNAAAIYSLDAAAPSPGAHILLVDDVITTGATLSACATALRSVFPGIRISVLTIGISRLD